MLSNNAYAYLINKKWYKSSTGEILHLQYGTFFFSHHELGLQVFLVGRIGIFLVAGVSLLAHRPHNCSEDLFYVLPSLGRC